MGNSDNLKEIEGAIGQINVDRALPEQQIFFTPDNNFNQLFSKKHANFENDSVREVVKKVQVIDEAFINSILSYAIYVKNIWTMENINKDFSSLSMHSQKALKDKDELYNLKVWHFIKNTFELIPDKDLKIPSMGTELNNYNYMTLFNYSQGQYSALDDLAHASVMKSKDPNGDGYILHVCFRGTEFSRLPAYIAKAYPDMSAYYENFKPLEKHIMEYAKNPDNKISQIQVSGHSLGGAMVQEFMKHNSKDSSPVPIKGYTFGSPGSKKHFFHKFLTLGYHAIVHKKIIPWQAEEAVDSRINEFYHSNDPVPKLGLLGYQKGGNMHNLLDTVYKESKLANLEKVSFIEKAFVEKIPAFGKMITYFKENFVNKVKVRFHDSKRYSMNLRNMIEGHFDVYPYLGKTIAEKCQHWKQWVDNERKFSSLSIKYRGAFEYWIKEDNPTLEKKDVTEMIFKIREQMKYDSDADIVLAKRNGNISSYDKYLMPDSIPDATINALSQANETSEINERVARLRKTYTTLMQERTEALKNKR